MERRRRSVDEAKLDAYNAFSISRTGIQLAGVAYHGSISLGGMARQRASGQGPPEVRGGREQTLFFRRTKVTPLYYAAYEGHLSIVALLLDAGANAREPDHRGDTPLKRRGNAGTRTSWSC